MMTSVTGMVVRVLPVLMVVRAIVVIVLMVVRVVPVAMIVRVIVAVVRTWDRVERGSIGPLDDPELGGRNATAVDPVDGDGDVVELKRGDHVAQPVERKAGVEQRAEHHIAGGAGEAVQIQRTCHVAGYS